MYLYGVLCWLCIVNHPQSSQINLIWSCCTFFFIYYWIHISNILLRILGIIMDIDDNLLSVISLPAVSIKLNFTLLHRNGLRDSYLAFWMNLERIGSRSSVKFWTSLIAISILLLVFVLFSCSFFLLIQPWKVIRIQKFILFFLLGSSTPNEKTSLK